MYSARLTQTVLSDRAAPGEDRPVVRWPKPQIRRFTAGDRTVLQLMLSREALAELQQAGGEIEVQLVPDDFD